MKIIITRCKSCKAKLPVELFENESGWIVEIHPDDMLMHECEGERGKMNSLKDIAKILREKAAEIGDAYYLNAIKLLKAADILDPIKKPIKEKHGS